MCLVYCVFNVLVPGRQEGAGLGPSESHHHLATTQPPLSHRLATADLLCIPLLLTNLLLALTQVPE